MNQNNSRDEQIDIAIANLVFSGLSIAQMEKIPKWLLENMEKNKTKFKETLHQELQKARHDWLREEIVKLGGWLEKGTHMVDCPISHIHLEVSSCICGAFNGGKNHALQTTIDRYQFELDQPK